MLHLKALECTKIVQNGSILWALLSNDLGAEASENEQGRGGRTVGRLERPDQVGISGPQLPRSFDLKVERLRGGQRPKEAGERIKRSGLERRVQRG